MRGRGSRETERPVPDGITPAYAGKSFLCAACNPDLEDHPRVCGEESQVLDYEVRKEGSPPRMRGRARTMKIDGKKLGITPAYAGKRLNGSLL